MVPALATVDEESRIRALRDYAILDTLPEQALDDLTALAAHICGAPMATISLVDTDRQWFKSNLGMKWSETPRAISFCGHVVHQRALFTVPDALQDERFADNPMVTSDPGIRFYAGAPLVTAQNEALGSLCVMDRVARKLTPDQEQALSVLARQVMAHLELRRQTRELIESEGKFRLLAENITDVFWISSPCLKKIYYVSPAYDKIWGHPAVEIYANPHQWIDTILPEDRSQAQASFAQLMDNEPNVNLEYRIVRPDRSIRWIHNRGFQVRDAAGKVIRLTGVATDITERKKMSAGLLRLAAIVEFSNDAIIGKDLNGIVTSWNKGAEKIFGYSDREMVGSSILRLIPSDRRDEENLILGKMKKGESLEHFETIRQTKNGRLINVSVTASPIRDATGKPIGVSKVARDITERKLTEKALRDSQERFEIMANTISQLAWIAREDGYIVWYNQRWYTYTGTTPQQMEGWGWRSVHDPKVLPRVIEQWTTAIAAGEEFEMEFPLRGADGQFRRFLTNALPLKDAEGRVVQWFGTNTDVDELKRKEKALAESDELSRGVLNSVFAHIAVLDRDGRIIAVNDAWSQFAQGRSADREGPERRTGVGTNYLEVCRNSQGRYPEEAMSVYEGLLSVLNGELDNFMIEYPCQAPEAQQWFLMSATPLRTTAGGAVVSHLDISARKQAEEQVTEQAEFLDKARDAILVRDLEGRILFWNNGAHRVYGWTREEVCGRNSAEVLYSNPETFLEFNERTIREGEWVGELQHLTKGRGKITIEARWTLIRDNAGQPKSVLAINTDITEKKKIEAQFMRAQRMESIGTLAGGVAHDLNNILAPIMMSIELLKDISEHPQAREILETIETSAKRGGDIVRQVLSFARGLEGERIEVQPKHLLKDLESIIKDTFPKDIRLQFIQDRDTWTILGDPTQVHQILLNLCVNARDAMPHGGNLAISVENAELDEQYAGMNFQARPGRYVMISVTDSGTGIPPDLIDKIFEPFFTTKELKKGTGLGLSTVMAIVKSHEGIVNVYSEPGKGTTFKIYLPALDPSGELPSEISQASLPRGDGETILVIDDEASILTITSQTLQAFGYKVLTAVNGAAAVAVYAQRQNEISGVLTDMMMPVMDGPATIHALKEINPAVKIVAASGLNANGSAAKVSGVGVDHFLTKPYTAGTMLKTIRSLLDEK